CHSVTTRCTRPASKRQAATRAPTTSPLTEIEKRQDRSPVPSAFDYAPAPESRHGVALEARYGLFIGVEWVEPKSGEYQPTISPATEEPLAEVAYGRAEDVGLVVERESGEIET